MCFLHSAPKSTSSSLPIYAHERAKSKSTSWLCEFRFGELWPVKSLPQSKGANVCLTSKTDSWASHLHRQANLHSLHLCLCDWRVVACAYAAVIALSRVHTSSKAQQCSPSASNCTHYICNSNLNFALSVQLRLIFNQQWSFQLFDKQTLRYHHSLIISSYFLSSRRQIVCSFLSAEVFAVCSSAALKLGNRRREATRVSLRCCEFFN